MRLLKRHSDEEDAPAETEGTDTDTTTAPADAATRRTAEMDKVDERAAEPARPGLRQRFRRTVTVPMTVPRRSVRRTVTIPARRVEPTAAEPTWALAPILATVAGGALAVIGIIALIRTGLDETWFRPRVEVLNADHTALLGALEIGAGALLLLLGLAGSRVLVAMAGIAGALVCTAAAVEPQELDRELAIESWWAWVLAGAGVVLTLVALQEPRTRTRSRGTVIDVR